MQSNPLPGILQTVEQDAQVVILILHSLRKFLPIELPVLPNAFGFDFPYVP